MTETESPEPEDSPESSLTSLAGIPIRFAKWLAEGVTGQIRGFLAGILVALGAAAGTGLGTAAVHLLNGGKVPRFAVLVAAVVGTVVGLLLAIFVMRALQTQKLKALRAERQLQLERLARLEPVAEAMKRANAYSTLIGGLVRALIAEKAVTDRSGPAGGRELCMTLEDSFREATGKEYRVSIWREGLSQRMTERLERLPDTMSGPLTQIGDRLSSSFEIVAAPHHEEIEVETFAAVPVNRSWLKTHQVADEDEQTASVFHTDHPDDPSVKGKDLDAFVAHGFNAVSAVSFTRGDRVYYVVGLSESRDGFSAIEDQCLDWLRNLLVVDEALGLARDELAAERDYASPGA
jgi:hypothetical protein